MNRQGAVDGYGYELLGHVLSGNLFVGPTWSLCCPLRGPCVTFQHPGVKFEHVLSGRVRCQYGPSAVDVAAGDSLLFEASALKGGSIEEGPVSYLSVVFTPRR